MTSTGLVLAAPLGLAVVLALSACGSFSSDGAWIPAGHCTVVESMDVGGPTDATTPAAALEEWRDYYAQKLDALPAETQVDPEFFDFDSDKLGIVVAGFDAAMENAAEAEASPSAVDAVEGGGEADSMQVSADGDEGTAGYISVRSDDGGATYLVDGFSVTGPSPSGHC